MSVHEQCFNHKGAVPNHAFSDHCTCGHEWPCEFKIHEKHSITYRLNAPPHCDTCDEYFGPLTRLKK